VLTALHPRITDLYSALRMPQDMLSAVRLHLRNVPELLMRWQGRMELDDLAELQPNTMLSRNALQSSTLTSYRACTSPRSLKGDVTFNPQSGMYLPVLARDRQQS
jgi:hypothetical protein